MPNSKNRQISTPSPSGKERTGIARLYKRVGVRIIAWYYQHPTGESETLATVPTSAPRQAYAEAERIAKRKALDIQQGHVIAGSCGEMIARFAAEKDPAHYRDQSRDGKAVRALAYANLIRFFGRMTPAALRTLHGYQYLDARAAAGAPLGANKEMWLMSTICHQGVRWGLIEANPFTNMIQNTADYVPRAVQRSQIIRFYLWSLHQPQHFRTMGCAAMFAYLTGFRAAEVRPFHVSGLGNDGVRVTGAKRKRGDDQVIKLRDWSPRLRAVVARARQRINRVQSLYLFANRSGRPYTRSGWGAVWQDAMQAWISSFDDGMKRRGAKITTHAQYFALLDVRPAAITRKIEQRSADAYDFAAHANPSTTHKHYDRRRIKRARPTE